MLLKDKLRLLRETNNLLQRQVAAALGLDSAVYCKFENGDRLPKEDQLRAVAVFYGVDFNELKKIWLATKVYAIVQEDSEATEILGMACESVATYGTPKAN